MSADSIHLGVDLGGTNLKWALLDANDVLVDSDSTATHAASGPEAVLSQIATIVERLSREREDLTAVGLALPGRVDRKQGTTITLPNFFGLWKDRPVRDWLSTRTGCRFDLVNDVSALALAEFTLGAGQGTATMFCVAVGTGIGGALVINGSVHSGVGGADGEVGHLTIDPRGPICVCGNRGCLEAIASGVAIARDCGAASAEQAMQRASTGDAIARNSYVKAAAAIAYALSAVIAILSPDAIVIGGGVAQAGDLLLEPIRHALRHVSPILPIDQIAIRRAALGPFGGAVGAALWAKSGSSDFERGRQSADYGDHSDQLMEVPHCSDDKPQSYGSASAWAAHGQGIVSTSTRPPTGGTGPE
jgi:glucokinase